jgi:hypothetical protein
MILKMARENSGRGLPPKVIRRIVPSASQNVIFLVFDIGTDKQRIRGREPMQWDSLVF